MANVRLIKRRIRTAKNISQITHAMELVAASKMKRAQAAAIAGKLYAGKIYEMVMQLSRKVDVRLHPLLQKPAEMTGQRLVMLISTNKGLCGGLNTNLFRFILREYPHLGKFDWLTLGRKGADFVSRMGGNLLADFSKSVPFTQVVPALTEFVTREYLAGKYDGVDLVYNEFFSALRQEPRQRSVVPLTIEHVATGEKAYKVEFVIEPNPVEVFARLLPHYLENQVRDAVLQAEASEHSARMVAMKNATDNAKGLMQDLNLVYNKARQEKITYEISDLITARLAVET